MAMLCQSPIVQPVDRPLLYQRISRDAGGVAGKEDSAGQGDKHLRWEDQGGLRRYFTRAAV
jgi:hypothetical protein